MTRNSCNTRIIGYTALGDYTGHSAAYWRNRSSDGNLPFPKHRNPYEREVWFLPSEVDEGMRLDNPEWQGPSLGFDLSDITTRLEDALGLVVEVVNDRNAIDRILRNSHKPDADYLCKLGANLVDYGGWVATVGGVSKDITRAIDEGRPHKYIEALRTGGQDAAIEAISESLNFRNETFEGLIHKTIFTSSYKSTDEIADERQKSKLQALTGKCKSRK